MRVELWVHTTCGIELEIRDADTGKIIVDRFYVCDEDEDEIEGEEKDRVRKKIAAKGWELVGEVWS